MKPAALADDSSHRPRCADMTEVRAAIDALDKRLVA